MRTFKKLRQADGAVSPVIAVILMVAITVVLAATVYVWVSGFSGSGTNGGSRNLALTSNGAITDNATVDSKTYTVASASAGTKWSDLTFTVNGAKLEFDADGVPAATGEYCVITSGGDCTAPTDPIVAGQQLRIMKSSLAGSTLRVLDTQANSVVLTLNVG